MATDGGDKPLPTRARGLGTCYRGCNACLPPNRGFHETGGTVKMKHDRDLFPEEEPMSLGWAIVLVLFIIFSIGLISWVQAAPTTCAVETQEARITEAIEQYKPTVWIFESAGLNTFMQAVTDWGLMAGRPTNVDKVYVTLYDGHYTIFFLFKSCIVAAYHGPNSVMERILPK
jgi:hypothetical protein